ncbi:MAG: L,D-transpeptidase [Candidatus Wallbacteria bacterium]|nr:L,D-transpeptidase [Candidatus Wallbacteria bacterium]
MKHTKALILILTALITCSAFCADFYVYQPAVQAELMLHDGPGSAVVNCRVSTGTELQLLDATETHALFVDAKGNCGWAECTIATLERDFQPADGADIEEQFADEPGLRDFTLDTLNSSYPPSEADLKITVSLRGLTMHVLCEKEGFDRVYPVGVGVKGSSGKSITPTCGKKGVPAFRTHYDPKNREFYMPKRWSPSYFGGFPFIRLNIKNSDGAYTYGMHGPITQKSGGEWYLQRGYVSHGCMRMRAGDVKELYPLTVRYPKASLVIQQEYELDKNGGKIDCDYPLWSGS